jgi:hypothetical protein
LPGASARGLLTLVLRWCVEVAILDFIFSQNSFKSDASERLTLSLIFAFSQKIRDAFAEA